MPTVYNLQPYIEAKQTQGKKISWHDA